jgi:hypothetical protein
LKKTLSICGFCDCFKTNSRYVLDQRAVFANGLVLKVLCFKIRRIEMTNNLIPGAAFFSGSESFLKDLSAEDELVITGGVGSSSKTETSNTTSKSAT